MLQTGDDLPDIILKDQNGQNVNLRNFKDKQPLVIYFYPKDNTRICTAQVCSFRDHYEDFQNTGAEVIGISRDSIQSHKNVEQKRNLPFLLLSDPKGEALKKFGVPSRFGLLSGRVTFITNKNRKIIHAFRADFNATQHIKESLKILQWLD